MGKTAGWPGNKLPGGMVRKSSCHVIRNIS